MTQPPSAAELTISSEPEKGVEFVSQMLLLLKECGWDEQEIFGLHLAIEEAVVNAIKHGNQYDQTKNVRLCYEVSAERFHLQIEDEGSGFSPEDVPDPTDDDNLETPSGRGLMLMRAFMTDVAYNESGNCVTLVKVRD